MMLLQSIGLDTIFPIITTLVSLFFFVSVSEQYFRKRKTHQLVWAVAMFLFMITAGAEGLSFMLGYWDPLIYKIYYLFAAIQVTAMGAGVLYLFGNRDMINPNNSWIVFMLFGATWGFFSFLWFIVTENILFILVFIPSLIIFLTGLINLIYMILKRVPAIRIDGYLFTNLFVLFSLYIFVLMIYQAIISPLNLNLLATSQGEEIAGHGWLENSELRVDVRLFSPLFTIPGGIALIGGAFYSYVAWQWAIRKESGSFNLSQGFFNILIGVGALALGIGGALSGFGLGTLYISEVISVSLMYAGFLMSDKNTFNPFKIRRLKRGDASPQTM